MNITIQTVDFKESESLTTLINNKVAKLFHLSPETIRVDITLKEGSARNPSNKWCSLYLSHPGENQFVKRNSEKYEESISLAVDAMEKILRRAKTKRVNQRNDPK
jgi:ribosome-associated translation inhibitor RaiA